ncbi:MAG: PIN domain-containing protein [Anaerolineae bacterium]|nr:PIN domain-containing protein [Anaerolineae bacterium]
MIAVADTSFVIAVFDIHDEFHEPSLAIYRSHQPIYLPQTTLAEIGYFLTKRYGNLTASFFLARFPNTRYRLIPLADEDVARTAEILQKYADTRVDFVDATIAAVAERLNITRVLTLDRRDFSLIRPKHIQQFELLAEKA